MNFAIVDDSQLDGTSLETLILTYFSQKQLHCEITRYSSAEQFLAAYHTGDYSAIFLDILMHQTSGMDTAHALRAQNDQTPIIFVTNEDSYSLEGYLVQATDYILKPIQPERLAKTLDLLIKKCQPEPYIELKDKRKTRYLLLTQLLYIRALGHYLEIHTSTETFSIYMTLSSITQMLENAERSYAVNLNFRFTNCCRGYLVNLAQVQALTSDSLRLCNGELVPISRARAKETQAAYADYLFAKTRGLL